MIDKIINRLRNSDEWKFDEYYATYKDDVFNLWIANGKFSMEVSSPYEINLNFREQARIWKEIENAKRRILSKKIK